jgi:L-amino acid N-acyltransferase YncA
VRVQYAIPGATAKCGREVRLVVARGVRIRPAVAVDFESLWPIFRAVVATGTSYFFAPGTSREAAFDYWFAPGVRSYLAEDDGRVVGMYKLVANHPDLGSHVANASFMVDPACAGKGVGRAMGVHCLREARRAGFLAMQFNFVVSTNAAAVELWKQLGFAVVGTLPKVFRHRDLGLVDAYVMHRFLDDIDPEER